MESLQHTSPDHISSDALLDSHAPVADAASKEAHQRLFQRGLKWLGAGAVLMGISFGINFLLFETDTSFLTIMYVLTSVGAVCILKGLADMLGF